VIAFAAGGERSGDPSVVLSAVSWLAYTADRLGMFDAGPGPVPLVSRSVTFRLKAVCGSPLFSPCCDRNVHRLVLDGTMVPGRGPPSSRMAPTCSWARAKLGAPCRSLNSRLAGPMKSGTRYELFGPTSPWFLRLSFGCGVHPDCHRGLLCRLRSGRTRNQRSGVDPTMLADRRRHGDRNRHLVNALHRNAGLPLDDSNPIRLAHGTAISLT
jgi:hypothetical protein